MTKLWRRINAWPGRRRWPLKIGFVLAVVALTLYPKVWLIPVWIERLENLNLVLDPAWPALAELEEQVKQDVGSAAGLAAVAKPVEQAVTRRIAYAFDWDTWGVMDYVPTVAEVFALGREDCDGRAVVAASLLRRMGYEAWIVTDFKHTWVTARDPAVPAKDYELMSPGEGEKTLTSAPGGTQARLSLRTIQNVLRGVSFGMAVFPLGREIIILVALIAVLIQPRSSWQRRLAGTVALAAALVVLRAGGDPHLPPARAWVCGVAGGAGVLVGWLLLSIKGAGCRSQAATHQ